MPPDNKRDDFWNWVILAVVAIFMAWAVPNRLAEHRDAEFGAAVRVR